MDKSKADGGVLQPVADLVKTVTDLIRPFTDPVLSEAGLYLSEKIRFIRFQNSLKTVDRAKEILADQGKAPSPVTLKILFPLLEAAGLEEDDELIERWAHLLASAASGGEVLPSFVKILGELSADEVRLLDFISEYSTLEVRKGDYVRRAKAGGKTIREKTALNNMEFSVRMQNIYRLGLIELHPHYGYGYWGSGDETQFGLSSLGVLFMRACRGAEK